MYLYLVRCGDKIELFNRPEEFFLRESICGRELVNHIHKFNALIGYVKFTTDNVKGRGSGFTAQFTAEGKAIHIHIMYCE